MELLGGLNRCRQLLRHEGRISRDRVCHSGNVYLVMLLLLLLGLRRVDPLERLSRAAMPPLAVLTDYGLRGRHITHPRVRLDQELELLVVAPAEVWNFLFPIAAKWDAGGGFERRYVKCLAVYLHTFLFFLT